MRLNKCEIGGQGGFFRFCGEWLLGFLLHGYQNQIESENELPPKERVCTT